MKYLIITLCSLLSLTSCKDNNVQVQKENHQEMKVAEDAETIRIITADEFEEGIAAEDVQLIDVRTVAEYETGHLPASKNIVMNSPAWETAIEQLDTSKPVYVYCAKGGRSARCAQQLKDAGFSEIYDLQGGLSQWKIEGKAIE